MSEPKVLLTGLGIPESPRWHRGRLWFCNWIDRRIEAVSLDGVREASPMTSPVPMGYSIDWLPDDSLLVTGRGLHRVEDDGTLVPYADLSGLAERWNEIVVDPRGNVYVNSSHSPAAGASTGTGFIALVTPDGSVREVAGGIEFPNGMAITPDNRTLLISESFAGRLTAFDIDAGGGLSNRRVFAEGVGPDGICIDAEGAVWVGAGGGGWNAVVRVAEGGERLQRVELGENRAPFALMLGGLERRTLFIATAEWRMADGAGKNLERLNDGPRTGELLALPVSVPGAGRP